MRRLRLKRIDDGQMVSITSSENSPKPLGEGRTAYEAGYRRIVSEREVPVGRAHIFETGGNFVLVGREASQTFAFDAQPLIQQERTPRLVHTQHFLIEAPPPEEGGDAKALQPLSISIEDGWVWVDVEPVSR